MQAYACSLLRRLFGDDGQHPSFRRRLGIAGQMQEVQVRKRQSHRSRSNLQMRLQRVSKRQRSYKSLLWKIRARMLAYSHSQLHEGERMRVDEACSKGFSRSGEKSNFERNARINRKMEESQTERNWVTRRLIGQNDLSKWVIV